MNSDQNVVDHLKNTGFSSKNGGFKGRTAKGGGIHWFKAGDGTDRKLEADIAKGELGDIVFMGNDKGMEGHAVLLNGPVSLMSAKIDEKTTVEMATLSTISTSSESDPGNLGYRNFTFEKQKDGSWKNPTTGYVFRGYGQLNPDFFKQTSEE